MYGIIVGEGTFIYGERLQHHKITPPLDGASGWKS